MRGKRGRGAAGKSIVFSIFKRNGCVYTEIVADCKKATLQAIIRGRVAPEAVIHSDRWRGYDGLVDVGYAKHFPLGEFLSRPRAEGPARSHPVYTRLYPPDEGAVRAA